jgi:hypothetical protein
MSTIFAKKVVVASGVNIRFEAVEDRVVCFLDVSKSSSPVYEDTIKGKKIFYIRVGNTTRILTGAEMINYTKVYRKRPFTPYNSTAAAHQSC